MSDRKQQAWRESHFRLVMAVQPVAFMVWAHHVGHGQVVPAGDPLQPQQQAYAA